MAGITAWPVGAHASSPAIDRCMRLRADIARADGSNVVAVAVYARCNVTSLDVNVYVGGGHSARRRVTRMRAGESRAWRIATSETTEDVIVSTAALSPRRQHTLQVVASRAAVPRRFVSDSVILAFLGFVSTLGVAFIVERFARKREHAAQAIAWNATLFDRYEGAYRRFLATWGGAPNVDLLKTTFEQLQADAIVPPAVIRKYKQVLVQLEQNQDARERERVASELLNAASSALMGPTGLSSDVRP